VSTHTAMREALLSFPQHLEEGYQQGKKREFRVPSPIRSIVFSGIGGSKIGGEMVKQMVKDRLPLPFEILSSPPLPASLTPETLLILSSYSGNTIETLGVFREGVQKGIPSIVFTSGGELKTLASPSTWVPFPSGFAPRAMLGYKIGSLLGILERLFPDFLNFEQEIRETVQYLSLQVSAYAEPSEKNLPHRLARAIHGTIPVIYGTENFTASAAYRFKTQLNENAKNVAFFGVIPEIMHNEVVSFAHPASQPLSFIILRDPSEPLFFQTVIKVLTRYLQSLSKRVDEIYAEGESPLTRLMSLVVIGDWASYYLALENGEDPLSILVIRHLKRLFRRLECSL